MTGKIQALVGCQNDDCAAEVSFHLDMVKLWKASPICQNCYEYTIDGDLVDWHELPDISLGDLCE